MRTQNDYTIYSNKVTAITRILCVIACVLLVMLFVAIKVSESWLIVLSALLIVAYIATTSIMIRSMKHKLYQLKEKVYGKQKSYSRIGLFKEIWDEYEYDSLEGWTGSFDCFHKTKLINIDNYNNSIDIYLSVGKHEFLIEIDEVGIHLICDEETDFCKEKELLYTDYSDIESIYKDYCSFIVEHAK